MANGARKGVRGNYFHETTLAEFYTIHVNLHVMEFSVKQISFVEVPKIHKIREIYGPRKKSALYGSTALKLHSALRKSHCENERLEKYIRNLGSDDRGGYTIYKRCIIISHLL